jgi:acyl carrier protein
MSTPTEILRSFIVDSLLKDPGRALGPDEALVSSGLIDSFSLVDLALFVETSFGVRLHDVELRADVFDTLDQLTTLIEARRREAG